jgi:RNA polymerase sigma factor (sigma-70 family)
MADQGAQERDLGLLRRIADGDRGAFEELYHRYHRRLFGYVFKVTRRQELVDEVLDDTLLAVWQGAASFGGRSRPSTWIFGIAYRKSLKALRRLSRERGPEASTQGSEPPEPDELPAPPDGPESLMVRRELGSALGRALAELPAARGPWKPGSTFPWTRKAGPRSRPGAPPSPGPTRCQAPPASTSPSPAGPSSMMPPYALC